MNLFNLENYEEQDILDLITLAIEFKNGKEVNFKHKKIIANLFFEPSTRTHYSFDTAAKRLGCETINFIEGNSSMNKGESFYDTIKTFEAFGVDAMVVRHQKNKYYEELSGIKTPILSGGDGSGNHPTQSLLDLMTIYEEFGYFSGLKIVICGDIRHSRVARTNYNIMTRLGMDVKFVAPEEYKINFGEFVDLDSIISDVDVIMLLRVQMERHDNSEQISEYNTKYGLNCANYKLLGKNTIIMHPAPFNRGVELTDEIVESEKSRIFKQIENGVYIRMGVIYNAIK